MLPPLKSQSGLEFIVTLYSGGFDEDLSMNRVGIGTVGAVLQKKK